MVPRTLPLTWTPISMESSTAVSYTHLILDSLAVAGVEERVHITVHILRKLYPLLDNAKWKITVSLAWNGENWEMVEIEEGEMCIRDRCMRM